MEQDEKIWLVSLSRQTSKQRDKLPPNISDALEALLLDIRHDGPERRNWPHYGKIKGKAKNVDMRHCHLNKDKPIYVAVWVVEDMVMQLVEVRYVGTHENADYRRIN
jgi:hypothetical protein